jgi:hypothetical protein
VGRIKGEDVEDIKEEVDVKEGLKKESSDYGDGNWMVGQEIVEPNRINVEQDRSTFKVCFLRISIM